MQLIELLGVKVTAASMVELNAVLSDAVATGHRCVVANHNLHSVYLYHRDQKLRDFFARARLAHIDGMSLVFLARFFGYPLCREHRVTYVDWVRPLMAEAEQSGWRVFFLGSKPGVGNAAAKVLKEEFPRLEIAVHHGFFNMKNAEENREVVKKISVFRPQILMVGLGMPRQEHWIFDHLDDLRTNVILPVGACMDYVAGAVPTPPRWMGQVGLEWLYRLGCEPRRLAGRYLVEPWFIIRLLLRELLVRKLTSSWKL